MFSLFPHPPRVAPNNPSGDATTEPVAAAAPAEPKKITVEVGTSEVNVANIKRWAAELAKLNDTDDNIKSLNDVLVNMNNKTNITPTWKSFAPTEEVEVQETANTKGGDKKKKVIVKKKKVTCDNL